MRNTQHTEQSNMKAMNDIDEVNHRRLYRLEVKKQTSVDQGHPDLRQIKTPLPPSSLPPLSLREMKECKTINSPV